MPQSMTGFAQCERIFGDFLLVCRIKSVNHRFLDLSMRLPDGCESLERDLSAQIKQRFSRGHLECSLMVMPEAGANRPLELDETVLAALLVLEKRILASPQGESRAPLSLDRLFSWPGLIQESRVSVNLVADAGREVVASLLAETMDALTAVRAAEGRELVEVVQRHVQMLQQRVGQIENDLPRVRALMEQRLRERVLNYVGGLHQDERLAQELAYLLNRGDVLEEMDRMAVHIREISAILTEDLPVGKRLDFLCQELHRETNTLCTKVGDGELSCLGVDIKVLVEQMREQAQNLE